MLKELAGVVTGIVTSVVGAVADAGATVCDIRDDHSPRCEQVRELSTACDADDVLGRDDD